MLFYRRYLETSFKGDEGLSGKGKQAYEEKEKKEIWWKNTIGEHIIREYGIKTRKEFRRIDGKSQTW